MNQTVAAPVFALSITGFCVIGISLASFRVSRNSLFWLSFSGIVISMIFSGLLWSKNETAFGGMLVADNFALVFNFIFLISAALCLLLALGEHERGYLLYHEYFAVTLFAAVGMLVMAAGNNLLIIYLGLETLSVSLYILVGTKRTEPLALESAIKYFLLGTFASAFLLYGIALIYGAVGALSLPEISRYFAANNFADNPLIILGVMLVIAGLGFKIAIFPFHIWAPDVYQGAPTPSTAFISTGSKAAGFAVMLRLLHSASGGTKPDWIIILTVLAVLTMFVGNITAIAQTQMKRMLAYSSVTHAGYMLIGVVAWNENGTAGVLFYLLVFTFMNVGAFGVLSLLSSRDHEFVQLDDFKGLAFRKPVAALIMALFMFSLAGLPPTAGFFGKFYLFAAAVKSGHIALVIFGVVNSMISLYYYIGIVVLMFMKKSGQSAALPSLVPAVAVSLFIAACATLGIGIFPSYLMDAFKHFATSLL